MCRCASGIYRYAKNGMLDEKTLFSTRDSMKNTIDTMGSSLVKTTGIAYAIACDKAAGVDVDKIQKHT